jgi:hypothetical protein
VNIKFGILLAQSPFQILTTIAASKENDAIIASALYLKVAINLF